MRALQACAGELIGTYLLVLFGTGAVALELPLDVERERALAAEMVDLLRGIDLTSGRAWPLLRSMDAPAAPFLRQPL